MHTILGEISDFGFYFSKYRTYEWVFVKENPNAQPPIIPQRGMVCGFKRHMKAMLDEEI